MPKHQLERNESLTTVQLFFSKSLLLRVFLLFFCIIIAAEAQTTLRSGCELCASTGSCSSAFRGTPGKFCGRFQSFQLTSPCCCPMNSVCKLSQNSCQCHVPSNNNYNPYVPRNRQQTDNSAWMAVFFLTLVCCCCIMGSSGSRRSSDWSGTPTVVHATPLPPATAPGWNPGYGSTGTRSGGGGLGTALGGFAAGAVVGDIIGSMNRNRGFGGGGGYDIAGDTGGGGFGGGGFFGGGGGGYDIAGDTGGGGFGGGGYDFGGDTGGGGFGGGGGGYDIAGDTG